MFNEIVTLADLNLRQYWVLQSKVSLFEPEQVRPPYAGAGLSHSLVLLLIPVPHVSLHDPHSAHSLHMPLIAIKEETNFDQQMKNLPRIEP